MVCHFSIMTQLYPRLDQIPQGEQFQGRRTVWACDGKSSAAGACGWDSSPPQISEEQKAVRLGRELDR